MNIKTEKAGVGAAGVISAYTAITTAKNTDWKTQTKTQTIVSVAKIGIASAASFFALKQSTAGLTGKW